MSTEPETERVQQIRKKLEEHDTQYLINVWKTNDRREWTPEAFEAIHDILLVRLGILPSQRQRNPKEAIEPRQRRQRFLPTHIEGEVEFQYLSPEDARYILGRLRETLSAEKASNIRLSEKRITFDVSLFRFVSNWNVLTPVDEGEFIARPGELGTVKYKFSFARLFVIVTLIAICFLLLLLPSLGPGRLAVYAAPCITWLFLYGLNYIVAVIRLDDFVWQAISHYRIS